MKVSLLVLSCLFTATAFAAEQKEVRNETRTRSIGEQVLQVSACSEPEISTYDYQAPIIKQDGSFSQDKNGNIRYHTMTKIKATSTLQVKKCVVTEQYLAQVSGSFWNTDESEIQGTAKRSGAPELKNYEFTKDQDLDVKKLQGAAGGGGYIYNQNNATQLILSIAEGLKTQAKEECARNAADVQKVAIALDQSNCK